MSSKRHASIERDSASGQSKFEGLAVSTVKLNADMNAARAQYALETVFDGAQDARDVLGSLGSW